MATWNEFRKEKLSSKSKEVPYKEWVKQLSLEWKQKKLGLAPPEIKPLRPVYVDPPPPSSLSSTRRKLNEEARDKIVDVEVGKGKIPRRRSRVKTLAPIVEEPISV